MSKKGSKKKSSKDDSDEDIYDLNQKDGASGVLNAEREWTQDEIDEKTKGFIMIPQERWKNILKGQHVCYFLKKDGRRVFKAGADVSINPYDYASPDSPGVRKRHIGFRINRVTWSVPYEDIDEIWVKLSATELVIFDALTKIGESLRRMK